MKNENNSTSAATEAENNKSTTAVGKSGLIQWDNIPKGDLRNLKPGVIKNTVSKESDSD
ncbi:hypothetical protein P9176_09915 [Bacillus velezensis]|uniref:hypothetical protein n=1 Tax=Bacillus velezensis TaxID=492670 RepID=UPI002DBEE603|nr:hypothetical protein [Bacillus velezensis]MEC3674731.1 hypothetical protein [Bacillus velezensis]